MKYPRDIPFTTQSRIQKRMNLEETRKGCLKTQKITRVFFIACVIMIVIVICTLINNGEGTGNIIPNALFQKFIKKSTFLRSNTSFVEGTMWNLSEMFNHRKGEKTALNRMYSSRCEDIIMKYFFTTMEIIDLLNAKKLSQRDENTFRLFAEYLDDPQSMKDIQSFRSFMIEQQFFQGTSELCCQYWNHYLTMMQTCINQPNDIPK